MKALTLLKTGLLANPELEQAFLRLTILGFVLAYVVSIRSRVDVTSVVYLAGIFLLAVGIFAAICVWPATNATRRMLGIVADAGTITFGLLVAGNEGVTFVWAYPFVIVGNGFRYGRIYLHVSQVLCVVGFLTVLAVAPWWQNNALTGVGWLIAMMLLPFYVSAFSERLKVARRQAERALKECLEREGQSG